MEGRVPKPSPCQQTLTGTELAKWAGQTSPAEVKFLCFYTVETHYQSTYSDTASVTIVELQKPDIDINDESSHGITITCVLPESVRDGSSCNLYTGDQPQAYKEAQAIRMRWKSSVRILCTFSVSKNDLFSRLQERRDVSCDYRENTGFFSLSPHSDLYNFTGLTFPLTPSTALNPTSETAVKLWQGAVGVASGVVMFLMGLTAVSLCRRTKKNNSQRPTARQDDHSQCMFQTKYTKHCTHY
ncbi:uncharacterized protein [Salvelinus alpinus]|uniref:uncharacterized protein n=1 Tax=Salvelinus alpinus TaxID=8036 RepID=UPI0039FCB780